MTAFLSESDELWLVDVIHLGRAMSAEQARAAKLAAPAPWPAGAGGGGGAGAGDLVKRFRELADAPETVVEQIDPKSKDALLLGAGAKDVTRGAKAIKKAWKKKAKSPPSWEIDGDVAAGVAPDGSLGWAAATVNVADGDGGGEPIPHRFFAVYERREDAWTLVALHAALAPAAAR
jgi:hypothetical protein